MKYAVLRLQIDPWMEMIVEGSYQTPKEALNKRIELMKQYGFFTLIQVVSL